MTLQRTSKIARLQAPTNGVSPLSGLIPWQTLGGCQVGRGEASKDVEVAISVESISDVTTGSSPRFPYMLGLWLPAGYVGPAGFTQLAWQAIEENGVLRWRICRNGVWTVRYTDMRPGRYWLGAVEAVFVECMRYRFTAQNALELGIIEVGAAYAESQSGESEVSPPTYTFQGKELLGATLGKSAPTPPGARDFQAQFWFFLNSTNPEINVVMTGADEYYIQNAGTIKGPVKEWYPVGTNSTGGSCSLSTLAVLTTDLTFTVQYRLAL